MKKSDSALYNTSSVDFIPIACHYNENTLITKNGELIQTIQINGINSDKISKKLFNLREVVRKSINDSINDKKYAFWVHTIRRKTNLDDEADYYGFLSANIHDIWKRKNYLHDKFVNRLYITIVHKSSELKLKNFNSLVNSISSNVVSEFENVFFNRAEVELTKTVDNILQILQEYGAERLGLVYKDGKYYSEPMFLFRSIIQLNEDECELPISDLSGALASHQYAVGSDKIEVIGKEGKKFAALMSIKEYQEVSSEALDRFLQIPVEMIATEVFYFVDKKEVTKLYEEQNYILGISNDTELRKLKGLDSVFDIAEDKIKFCSQQISFMVIGEDLENLDNQVSSASNALASIGIVHVREDINLEKTFWAQLPANFSFLTRMKSTIIKNTAALASLHNFPTGHQYNPWGKAITLLRTEKGTPYFMNFHDSTGNGTTCIFGDKRSGKTTLLNFLLSEADKYLPSVVYITDKLDSGLYIKAKGGRWFQREKNIINPLLCEDIPENREYIFEFLKIIAKHYFDPLKDSEIHLLKSLSEKAFNLPFEKRKLSLLLQDIKSSDKGGQSLIKRIEDYLDGGAYYKVFEHEDALNFNEGEIIAFNLQAFDDEEYRKNHYPKEQKLVEQFEYDLKSMQAVKAGIVLSLQNLIKNVGKRNKIFVVDNFAEIVNIEHYKNLIPYLSSGVASKNGVMLFSVCTDKLSVPEKDETHQRWIDNINTSFILPSEVSVVGFNKIFNLSSEEFIKLSHINNSSRMFLIKQDGKIIVSELSIGGLPGIVKILSSTLDERNIYKKIVKEFGDSKPEDWVEHLYEELENI